MRQHRFFTILILGLLGGVVASASQTDSMGLAYQLTHVDTALPFPSPDGHEILYEKALAGWYQLFVMKIDGSGERQLTRDPTNHFHAAWSPDGQRIAFVSDRNGHEVIYVMNADGSGEEPLTPEDQDNIHPMWSPDGRRVIYCSDDDLHPPHKNASEIRAIEVNSRRVETLITGGTNTYPSWSPNGKRIVFRRMLGEMNSEVFVADADGSNPHNLTRHPAFDGWPAWSPDGSRIAFSSNRRANYQIWIMDADGDNTRLVANTEGRATGPRWSVDGRTLYFTNCKKVDFGVDCQIMAAPVPSTSNDAEP